MAMSMGIFNDRNRAGFGIRGVRSGVCFPARQNSSLLPRGCRSKAMAVLRLLCALINPGADEADLFLGQRSDIGFVLWGRHVEVGITYKCDILDEQAFSAITRLNHFPIFTSFKGPFAAIQAKMALRLLSAVTFHA